MTLQEITKNLQTTLECHPELLIVGKHKTNLCPFRGEVKNIEFLNDFEKKYKNISYPRADILVLGSNPSDSTLTKSEIKKCFADNSNKYFNKKSYDCNISWLESGEFLNKGDPWTPWKNEMSVGKTTLLEFLEETTNIIFEDSTYFFMNSFLLPSSSVGQTVGYPSEIFYMMKKISHDYVNYFISTARPKNIFIVKSILTQFDMISMVPKCIFEFFDSNVMKVFSIIDEESQREYRISHFEKNDTNLFIMNHWSRGFNMKTKCRKELSEKIRKSVFEKSIRAAS